MSRIASSNSFPLKFSLQTLSSFILLPRRRESTRNQEGRARWAVPERQACHWSLDLTFSLAWGGTWTRHSLQSLLARRADIYVPVQRGITGQVSSAVPSYSSRGIWRYLGNGLLWDSSRLNAPTLSFCKWEAVKCICHPWLLRLLIIVVVIDF